MKITDFLDKKKTISKKKLESCNSKEDRRKIEEQLYVPDELQPYTGELPEKKALSGKTVTLVFASEEDVKLLGKYFRVSEYQGNNIRPQNLKMLIDLLTSLETGRLEYDKENGTFTTNSTRSTKMGKRERRIKVS